MQVYVDLPLAGRDLRLDLFRGLANWAIFLDHIPHEVLSSITTRNYGFSDAADLFVFISGSAKAEGIKLGEAIAVKVWQHGLTMAATPPMTSL